MTQAAPLSQQGSDQEANYRANHFLEGEKGLARVIFETAQEFVGGFAQQQSDRANQHPEQQIRHTEIMR